MTLALFLGRPTSWLRFADGVVVDRGEGIASVHAKERVVAIIPGQDVTVHRASLPDLTDAQALGAGRLLIGDVSVTPIAQLHVAVGAADNDGNRTIVAIDTDRMTALLKDAAMNGFDPDSIIAAPLLLPSDPDGYLRADLGAETVIRGADSAFVDDPAITPLITGGVERSIDGEALETAIATALGSPEVELRQGAFARRRQWSLDHAWMRRFATMAAVLLGLVILGKAILTYRIGAAASRIEAENKALAIKALPSGTTITDPVFQLRDALAAKNGAGGGVQSLAAVVSTAVESTPNTELRALVFDGGGTLRATFAARSVGDLNALETRLATLGYNAASSPVMTDNGYSIRDITVSPR